MSNIPCDKEKVNEMKLHMLMLMNEWMMIVLMKCKCQMQCLTPRCYIHDHFMITKTLEGYYQGYNPRVSQGTN